MKKLKANHAGVIAARNKEVATLTATTEAKMTRQGELAVAAVKTSMQDRAEQRNVEQIIETPATSLAEKVAEVPKIQALEKTVDRGS